LENAPKLKGGKKVASIFVFNFLATYRLQFKRKKLRREKKKKVIAVFH
jgi:hypothetical protein